jgi:hypothetical protein
MGLSFSASVQTGSGAHLASYKMGTGSFSGVKRPGRGVDHPPPSSAAVTERVDLKLYSPFGPSWPVLGWPLPLLLPLPLVYKELLLYIFPYAHFIERIIVGPPTAPIYADQYTLRNKIVLRYFVIQVNNTIYCTYVCNVLCVNFQILISTIFVNFALQFSTLTY